MTKKMTLKELKEYAVREFIVVSNRVVIDDVGDRVVERNLYLKQNGARYNGANSFRDHLNELYEGTLTLKELKTEIYENLRVAWITVEKVFDLAE